VKPLKPFIQRGSRRKGKGVPAAQRFTVLLGSPGPDAVAAVRAIVELGKRQKVGKRLGAAAVIKAERG
jgi:hypothetical protein